MAEVIKTIKGRRYRYLNISRRVHGKVKTTSIYLGALEPRRRTGEGWLKGQITRRRGLPDEAEMLAQYNAKVERDEAKFNSELDKLHTEFGLKMPTYSSPGQVAPAVTTTVDVIAPPDDTKDETPDADPAPTV